MDSAAGLQTSLWRGCPIRTSPDQSLLAAPRGFSQPSTSFIGSRCQGIHRAPLLARRLDLSTSPSRQDQRSLPCLLRAEALSPCLLNYSSVLQVRFELASEADTQMARRPSGHHLSATRVRRQLRYAIGDSDKGMSVAPRAGVFARIEQPPVRAPRMFTIAGLPALVQAALLACLGDLVGPARGPPQRRGVEPRGFEPLTSAVQRRRSPS